MRRPAQRGGIVGWLALVLALVALVVAWTALEQRRRPASLEAVGDSARRATDRALAQARDRLEQLEHWAREGATDLAGEGSRRALDQLEELRREIAHTALDRLDRERLDADLEKVEAKLRRGSADALEALGQVVAEVRAVLDSTTRSEDSRDP